MNQRRKQCHKFAYLAMNNNIFARFPQAFFTSVHFGTVLDQSTTWNDLMCIDCEDDVGTWGKILIFPLGYLVQFLSQITWSNWEIIANTRSVKSSDDILPVFSIVFASVLHTCFTSWDVFFFIFCIHTFARNEDHEKRIRIILFYFYRCKKRLLEFLFPAD